MSYGKTRLAKPTAHASDFVHKKRENIVGLITESCLKKTYFIKIKQLSEK
jgi:hypothetical protein